MSSCIFFRHLLSQVPDTPEADPEEWKTAIARYEAAAANMIVHFVLVNKRASTVNVISIDTILRRHLQSVTRIDISYNYLRNSGVISLAYVFKSLGTSCALNLHDSTYIMCYMCLHPFACILRVPTFYVCLHSTCAYILRVLTFYVCLHVPTCYMCYMCLHPTCAFLRTMCLRATSAFLRTKRLPGCEPLYVFVNLLLCLPTFP